MIPLAMHSYYDQCCLSLTVLPGSGIPSSLLPLSQFSPLYIIFSVPSHELLGGLRRASLASVWNLFSGKEASRTGRPLRLDHMHFSHQFIHYVSFFSDAYRTLSTRCHRCSSCWRSSITTVQSVLYRRPQSCATMFLSAALYFYFRIFIAC